MSRIAGTTGFQRCSTSISAASFSQGIAGKIVMRQMLLGAFAAIVSASAAVAEYIPNSDFGWGNWAGAAYTDDASGRFSHCAISASYVSGDVLYFSIDAGGYINVAVESPVLEMSAGATYPVTLTIDRLPPIFGNAEAIGPKFAFIALPDIRGALEALQRGRTLWVQGPGWTGEYDLQGTFRALSELDGCAAWNATYAAAPAPASPQTSQAPALAATPSFDQTVLYQVATEMIAELDVEGFKYLTPAETQQLLPGSNAVVWASEQQGLVGGVLAVPSEGLSDLRQTDGDDIGFVASMCDGEMATTTRALATSAYQAREVRAMCVGDSSETETYMTKVLIGPWVLYTLLEFNAPQSGTAPQMRQTMSEDVAVRAASYVAGAIE